MRVKLLILILPVAILLGLALLGMRLSDPMKPDSEPGDWRIIQTQNFGHMDHDLFYFDIEQCIGSVRSADIILLGTSRTLFGYDLETLLAFSRETGIVFYNLGFPYRESVWFPLMLFERYGLSNKIVVIETDSDFFTRGIGRYAQAMLERGMVSSVGRFYYATAKFRLAQLLTRSARALGWDFAPSLDLFQRVLYRSLLTGAWDARYFRDDPRPLAELLTGPNANSRLDDPACLIMARKAVEALQARNCKVILAGVPAPDSPSAEHVQALALNLGLPWIRTDFAGLMVRDGEHLTQESAKANTEAFLAEIRKLLSLRQR